MSFRQGEDWIQSHRDVLMDMVRIYLGVGLFFKGVFFLMHNDQLPIPVGSGSFAAIVPAVPYIHIVGGLLLALGFLTRLAALAQIPVLTGALFYVTLPKATDVTSREGMELAGLVLFLSVLIFLWGPGRLSLSALFGGRHSSTTGNAYFQWTKEHPDMFLDLIRAYLGVGLFVKGFYIMQHRQEFLEFLESSGGLTLGAVIAAHYVIPAHFAGGVLLALGLITRVAAAAQLPLLVGAVFWVHLPHFNQLEMRQNLELSALVLFLLTLITAHNSGRCSLDHVLQKGARAHLAPQPAQ